MYGMCLENGTGVPVDQNKAAECYGHSAMRGYSKAQYADSYCL
jgi:TPR repeat protein